MISQLLLIEMVVKGVAGGLLLLVPRTLARVLGLPSAAEPFWARLLGAMLLGLAGATFLEERLATQSGLGLGGHVVLNLTMALAIFGLIILGRAGGVRRGRVGLGLMAGLLVLLAMVELAWV